MRTVAKRCEWPAELDPSKTSVHNIKIKGAVSLSLWSMVIIFLFCGRVPSRSAPRNGYLHALRNEFYCLVLGSSSRFNVCLFIYFVCFGCPASLLCLLMWVVPLSCPPLVLFRFRFICLVSVTFGLVVFDFCWFVIRWFGKPAETGVGGGGAGPGLSRLQAGDSYAAISSSVLELALWGRELMLLVSCWRVVTYRYIVNVQVSTLTACLPKWVCVCPRFSKIS